VEANRGSPPWAVPPPSTINPAVRQFEMQDSQKYSNIAQEKTLKTVLEILPVEIDAYRSILVCEISNEGFSYAIKNDDTNTYVGVSVSHFNKNTGADDDYSINLQNGLGLQSLLSGNFKKVYIINSFGESVLIPFYLYDSQENKNALNLIHGDLQDNASILTDVIAQHEIYNSYRVSTPLLSVIKSKFPGAINRHQYTVLLKQVPAEEDKMLVIFYSKKIVVMLNKNKSTQFINTFAYTTAEEVLYILLNTCKQFEAENIPLEISGMIENNSALSKEIFKYFASVSFKKLPAGCNYSEEITKHPSHYFSHIFAADSCE